MPQVCISARAAKNWDTEWQVCAACSLLKRNRRWVLSKGPLLSGAHMERNIFGSRRSFPKPIVAKRTSCPSPTTTTSTLSTAGSSKQSDKQEVKCDYTNCPADILERFQLFSVGGGRFLGQQNEEDEEDLHHRRMSRYVFTPF